MAVIDIDIQVRNEGQWTIVDVEGEIDVFTAPKLRERLVDLIDEGRHRILVDLAGVSFMDSTGLGTLVGGLKRVKEHDGVLSLVAANRSVVRVLAITGLDKVFPIYDTLDQALTSQ